MDYSIDLEGASLTLTSIAGTVRPSRRLRRPRTLAKL